MKLTDFVDGDEPSSDKGAGSLKEQMQEMLYREVSSERIAQLVASGRERAREELAVSVEQILNRGDFPNLADNMRERLRNDTLDMVLGLGPLEGLLSDASVTEIMVNGAENIFYEREGIICRSKEAFSSEEQLRLVLDRIVSPLGRRVDEQSPIVNARLPEGHRVNAIIPPLSLEGTTVTIRKFRASAFTLEDLVALDSLSIEMAQLLAWAVQMRCNIAVSGGTGGGKTTLLNALSRQIPARERIVTIEDSAELRFDHHPHVVRLEARMANAEGKGTVSIRDLVINSLRMRPDRIIVGECRGAEAVDMLQAMNTGHDGSLTTLHANSPAEVVPRLVMMVRYGMDLPTDIIEEQIASAFDLVVQQDRIGGGHRRITQIAVRDADDPISRRERKGRLFIPVVEWNREEQAYQWTRVPSWVSGLSLSNIATEDEVMAWRQELHLC